MKSQAVSLPVSTVARRDTNKKDLFFEFLKSIKKPFYSLDNMYKVKLFKCVIYIIATVADLNILYLEKGDEKVVLCKKQNIRI